ncbi:30S ribosomal protein S17 [Candidatus Woesearchaeota archaeon]|jgi:small subunit ribosomal protein S17|nr:30S ribosomal protein S17 [Candidatus Woesearchaeota archaeon]
MTKEILGVKAPKNTCTDKKCPFHGQINVKSELFKGKVIKKDINRSATIEWTRPYFVPKFERYEVRRSRMRVHNPGCIDAGIGQNVLVAKTRPLSKNKNHVIIKIIEDENETQKKTVTKKVKAKEESEDQ